jgi:hypothetical protein
MSIRVLLCALVLAASAATASATTIVVPTDDELFAASRAVVAGRVTEIRSRRTDGGRAIFTYVTVDVEAVLAGDAATGRIVLKEIGGRVGDDFTIVYGTPEYTVGERVLLYLDTDGDGAWRTAMMCVGKFSVVSRNGRDHVVRRRGGEGVFEIEPAATGPTTDTAAYDAYVAAVRSRAAARRAATLPPAHAVPVEYTQPIAAADDEAHPNNFTFLDAQHPRWFEPDEGLAVPFKFKPVPSLLDHGEGGVRDALAAWSSVAGCSLTLELADDTELCGFVRDGESVLSFDDCRHQIGSPSCTGIIAIGGASGRASERKTINGVEFVRITEADVVFNDQQDGCILARRFTFREVLTHELGHAIGLGHSSENGPEPNPRLAEATMYYQLHDDGRAASLKPDDVDGVTFLYPIAEVAPSIRTEALATASAGSTYEAALDAYGGEAPLVWSLAGGALPAGVTLSPAGALSGTPAAKGVYTFAVTVADARGRTATRELSLDVRGPKPVVATAVYKTNRKLTVTASVADLASLEVWVNGVRVSPPLRARTKGPAGATRITIKGSAAALNATAPAGSNAVVLVSDGVASDPFAF